MAKEILSFKNVTKIFSSFSKTPIYALNNLSLKVEVGDIYGFAGLNGAGKTTSIKALLGLCQHDSGEIRLFEQKASQCNPHRLGFASETTQLPAYLNASEYLQYLSQLCNKAVSQETINLLLKRVGLENVGKKRISNFSKGMKQRLSLIASIVHEPDLIVLDEPSSGLDPMGRKMLKNLLISLNKQGKTVFFSTHLLSDIKETCNKVGILHKGRMIFEGSVNKLCNKYSSIELAFEKLIKETEKSNC